MQAGKRIMLVPQGKKWKTSLKPNVLPAILPAGDLFLGWWVNNNGDPETKKAGKSVTFQGSGMKFGQRAGVDSHGGVLVGGWTDQPIWNICERQIGSFILSGIGVNIKHI